MVIGAERKPELETGNGHTSCIMWSTCTCGSCLNLRDEHRVSLLRENFSWAYCPCGWVWLGCGFITIKSLSYICCIFKHHLLSEIKYSYCSHDAGPTDWSENQLCPQTLPVVPTDLLTCSGARPGNGIKKNLHNRYHLEICQKFMILTILFPIKSVFGRGSFLCTRLRLWNFKWLNLLLGFVTSLQPS